MSPPRPPLLRRNPTCCSSRRWREPLHIAPGGAWSKSKTLSGGIRCCAPHPPEEATRFSRQRKKLISAIGKSFGLSVTSASPCSKAVAAIAASARPIVTPFRASSFLVLPPRSAIEPTAASHDYQVIARPIHRALAMSGPCATNDCHSDSELDAERSQGEESRIS